MEERSDRLQTAVCDEEDGSRENERWVEIGEVEKAMQAVEARRPGAPSEAVVEVPRLSEAMRAVETRRPAVGPRCEGSMAAW